MSEQRHFLIDIIERDNAALKWGAWPDGTPRVHTRFPPEPNGFLHVGHTKSICLNYGLARRFGGKFNLRLDDTNPAKEESRYVEAIKRDVRWLGADWDGPAGGGLHLASNYFQRMYDFAEELVHKGKAYVCDLSAEDVATRRGTTSVPATSPFRDRPAGDSLRLLREMRNGLHAAGSRTLRAKIDLASPNFTLRDPVMYRIVHQHHHNTGDAWHIYPMYDWAHCLEDSIEGITHSICTLEFENNRPLYDWFVDSINEGRTDDGSGPWGKKIHHPQQIEFARLNLSYTVMSKRRFLELVTGGHVSGWDDPRMPTVAGLRRRGYTPEAIRAFCEDVGVTRFNSVIDVGRLENAIRDDLNRRAPRRMVVLRPLKVVIENYPEGQSEQLDAVNNPEDAAAGARTVPFSREIFVERDDFMEDPPKKFFRLSPGTEVRLRYAYFITCTGVVKDPATGEITELRCTYDPATRGGDSPDGRKVKATLHWVSARHAIDVEVRQFDRLFGTPEPGKATGNALDDLGPDSLTVLAGCKAELSLVSATAAAAPGPETPWGETPTVTGVWSDGIERYQFERQGYFCVDPDSRPTGAAGPLIFNRTVTLKDSWARVGAGGPPLRGGPPRSGP